MPKLTDKQEKFCKEYLIDYNATQAAIRAGYSERNAGKIGHELLEKTRIKERLEYLKSKQHKKLEIKAEDIAKHDHEISQVTWAELHDFDGYVFSAKPFEELTEVQKAAIKGVTQTGKRFTYILHDTDKAKERLMKFTGGYEKDNSQKQTILPPIVIKQAGE